MAKVRIGIIGCGGIGMGKHMPALAVLDNVEMVAFCDMANVESFPCKGNEAESVAGQARGKLVGKAFGVFEAIRFNVFAEHGFGEVERNNDISSGTGKRNDFFAPARARPGRGQQNCRGDQEKEAQQAFIRRGVDADGELAFLGKMGLAE